MEVTQSIIIEEYTLCFYQICSHIMDNDSKCFRIILNHLREYLGIFLLWNNVLCFYNYA